MGNLCFGGNTETGLKGATDQYPGWTRVDFVVDSGASATTLPRKLLGESSKLKEPVGYRSFRLADGSVVANEGTLEAKAWLLGVEGLGRRDLPATPVSGPSHLPRKQGDFGPEGVLPGDNCGQEAQDLPQERCLHPPGLDGHQQPTFRACSTPFRGAGRRSPVRPPNSGVQSRFGSSPTEPTGPLGPLEGDEPNAGLDDEEEEVAIPEAEEGRAAKPLRAPTLPSAEEVEAHMVSHIPYRAWCSHCVRGRGKSFARHRVNRQGDPEEVPVVSIDYGFFGAPGELPADAVGGAQMPVLVVVRDRKSKALFSHLVPSKGVEHFYPEHALVRDIKFLGYPSVVIKSDQEPAIKALAEAVKNLFAAKGGVRVQLENSPKGDDHGKSNGEAEAAVEITQGLCRTYKDGVRRVWVSLSIPSHHFWDGLWSMLGACTLLMLTMRP